MAGNIETQAYEHFKNLKVFGDEKAPVKNKELSTKKIEENLDKLNADFYGFTDKDTFDTAKRVTKMWLQKWNSSTDGSIDNYDELKTFLNTIASTGDSTSVTDAEGKIIQHNNDTGDYISEKKAVDVLNDSKGEFGKIKKDNKVDFSNLPKQVGETIEILMRESMFGKTDDDWIYWLWGGTNEMNEKNKTSLSELIVDKQAAPIEEDKPKPSENDGKTTQEPNSKDTPPAPKSGDTKAPADPKAMEAFTNFINSEKKNVAKDSPDKTRLHDLIEFARKAKSKGNAQNNIPLKDLLNEKFLENNKLPIATPLKPGDNNEHIRTLKLLLKLQEGKVDNFYADDDTVYNDKTAEAVRKFQASKEEIKTKDGTLNAETWKALAGTLTISPEDFAKWSEKNIDSKAPDNKSFFDYVDHLKKTLGIS